MKRSEMLSRLAKAILQIQPPHPTRVAIDGVDAAGKTMFADELADLLRAGPREIIRASVDDFHNPEHIRRQKGSLSPEGFYQDSFNYTALIQSLLKPLGPHGDHQYRAGVFDLEANRPALSQRKTASQNAILLVDGIFLLRPLLLPYWDCTIFLKVDFATTMARGISRDRKRYGSNENAAIRYRERYVPGQQLYFSEANPLDKADILIENNEIDDPELKRIKINLSA